MKKPSLRFLNPVVTPGIPHQVWNNSHPRDIRRAIIKAKFITGSYMLQTTKAIFGDKDILCPLCHVAPEARTHLLTECSALQDIRQPLIRQIQNYIPTPLLATKDIYTDNILLTQLILDPTHNSISSIIPLPKEVLLKMEIPARLMCYKLHYRRAQTLGYRH